MINFLIVHYNTPKLTSALISSINKFVSDARIYVFENSARKYDWGASNVTVFDNSKGKIVNFDSELKKYPNREKSLGKYSKFGSFKHCISVDRCFDMIDGPFILLDSDVLLKKDPSEIVNDSVYWTGEAVDWTWGGRKRGNDWPVTKRVKPFICYINLTKCKEDGIRYFDEHHMAGLWNPDKEADSFDTGGWFYEQTKGFENGSIKCDDYIVHFGGASHMGLKRQEEFLRKNKSLYTNMAITNAKPAVVKKKYTILKDLTKTRCPSIDYLYRDW